MEETKPTTAFPERVIDLLDGTTVVVRPWSLKNGRIQRRRLTMIVDQLQAAGKEKVTLTDAFEQCETTISEIVRDMIGKDDAWMEEHLAYEDFYTLVQAVIQVCLLREGGGGVLGKILGAMGKSPAAALAPELAARIEQVRQQARGLGFQEPPETQTETSPPA